MIINTNNKLIILILLIMNIPVTNILVIQAVVKYYMEGILPTILLQ